MTQEKKNDYFLAQAILAVFFAVLLAWPVSLYVKKAKNPQEALTEDQLNSFVFNDVTVPLYQGGYSAQDIIRAGEAGRRTVTYSTTGEAILTANVLNITTLTPGDFTRIGQTPWSLLNSVGANLSAPQVLEVLLNKAEVINGFFGREGVQALTGGPAPIKNMVNANDYSVEKFLTDPTVQGALANPAVVNAFIRSRFIGQLLNTKAARYFLANPSVMVEMINNNQYLKAAADNENVKKALLNDPRTQAAARQIYR
jgi:hypothetical protein